MIIVERFGSPIECQNGSSPVCILPINRNARNLTSELINYFNIKEKMLLFLSILPIFKKMNGVPMQPQTMIINGEVAYKLVGVYMVTACICSFFTGQSNVTCHCFKLFFLLFVVVSAYYRLSSGGVLHQE